MSRTVVIGGGIIGLSIAWELSRRGENVTVLDARTAGMAASAANAGYIVLTLAGPVPTPGLVKTSLKWMLNPESPLYIRPRISGGFPQWLYLFWRACDSTAFAAGLEATTALRAGTESLLDNWATAGITFEMHNTGRLYGYSNPENMESDLKSFLDTPYHQPQPLHEDDLWHFEPSLSEYVVAGYHVQEDRLIEPISLVNGLIAKLQEAGVEIRNGTPVVDFETSGSRIVAVRTPAERLEADHVLISAGAWSGVIARMAGIRIPIEAGKGYGLDFQPAPVKPRQAISLKDAQIAVSPFEGGLRLGGTMEFSGINDSMAHRRIAAIEKGGKRYLRGIPEDAKPTHVWTGMRPMAPDGLPVMGLLPGFSNLSVSTGHSMLGLTLAPAGSVIMADLITTGVAPDVLKPFRVDRFRG